MGHHSRALIIGLGNRFRSDDGIGLIIVEELRRLYPHDFDFIEHAGDPADLIDLWNQRIVLVIDAVHCDHPRPGTLHWVQPLLNGSQGWQRSVSSHGLGLMEAIELGRILEKLPLKLVILGVEGENFSQGEQLSLGVAKSLAGIISSIPALMRQGESACTKSP